jgi:hypothetical protein
MQLVLKLLGDLNTKAPASAPVRRKYVVRVTAEEIARHLQYERKAKKKADPFRIRETSLIKIDKEIQRGMDASGFLSQQPAKIAEMVAILLGLPNASAPRIYMGTLVWNIRATGTNALNPIEVRRPNEPSEWRLEVSADAIYLTDSAHRHLAIAEAYNTWQRNPGQYSAFDPNFEFSVELYNLDRYGERELFFELNSKQKKISAAKAREVDVGSPIGALKDAIIQYDQGERRFLDNNIEVSSNQNRQHTLLTMSVFVSSIDQMFAAQEIRDAWKEEDTRAELAAEYCSFLYKLADTLVVRCDTDGDGVEEDVHPFRNLYYEVIKPVFDTWDTSVPDQSQAKVDAASARAAEMNKRLRERDIANSNATIRALFAIGGLVRRFENPFKVVDRLQVGLVVPAAGKFFQAVNTELLDSPQADVPIVSMNQDGTLNVQVQSKTIARLTHYLRSKLELAFAPEVAFVEDGRSLIVPENSAGLAWGLERTVENFRHLQLRFVGVRDQSMLEDGLRLAIKAADWKHANAVGKARLVPTAIELDESWQHPAYEDLVQWVASFELRLPAASNAPANFAIDLEFEFPELDGAPLKTKRRVACSVR